MATRPQVFVSAELPGDAVDALRRSFEVTVGDGLASADLANARGVVALLTDRVDAELLARAPELAVVANVATGVDNIDLAACKARGVVVTNTPDVVTEATADVAFGLLIDAARRISEGDRLVRAGQWERWSPSFHLGTRVNGMKLGIVGLGRVGRAMARRARGFGMHVGYHQRERLPPNVERALGATYVASLDELCETSDAVSIHSPLTDETRGLFSAERIAKMKPGGILVNTSRGPLVDEAALAAALKEGRLAAAGLDVFEHEPKVHPDLLTLPNVVLTPHIGSAEADTREAMAALAAANVSAVLSGQAPLTPVGSV